MAKTQSAQDGAADPRSAISEEELEHEIEKQRLARRELDARDRDERRARAGLLTRQQAGVYISEDEGAALLRANRHEDCDGTDRYLLSEEAWIPSGVAVEAHAGDRLPKGWRRLSEAEAAVFPTAEAITRWRHLARLLDQKTAGVREIERTISSLENKIEQLKSDVADSRDTLTKLRADQSAAHSDVKSFLSGFPPAVRQKIESAPPISRDRPVPEPIPDYTGEDIPTENGRLSLRKLSNGGGFVIAPPPERR